MKRIKENLIGLVDSFPKLRAPVSDFGLGEPEIRVTIATVNPETGTPQNWSVGYDTPPDSTGGGIGRIYCYKRYGDEGVDVRFLSCGPVIHCGDVRQYETAAKGLKAAAKRYQAIVELRGHTEDAAEQMGRWLESCGVSKVMMRPEGYRERSTWLNEGEWETLSVGQFIQRVRDQYPAAAQASETAVA